MLGLPKMLSGTIAGTDMRVRFNMFSLIMNMFASR